MKLMLLVLLSVTSFSLVSLARPVQTTPEWKYVATYVDDRDSWKTYYDAANIERHDKGMIGVWLKQIPITRNDAERRRIVGAIIENRKVNNMSVRGYKKFAYSLTLVEFDCSGRKARSISIKDYDRAEKLLGSDTKMEVPFGPVEEGSLPELILKAACKMTVVGSMPRRATPTIAAGRQFWEWIRYKGEER